MSATGSVLIGVGTTLLVVAAVGLWRLPDALARQHAATKSGTLALGLILMGAVLTGDGPGWGWRALSVFGLLVATLPVASHLMARAAARHAYTRAELDTAPLVAPPTDDRSREGSSESEPKKNG